MIRLSRSICIASPDDKVWLMVQRFGDLDHWHPAVESCLCPDRSQARIGATRHVALRDGLSMDEELVSASARDRRLEILTRTAPFPVSLMWQALTVFGVTTTDSAVLRWELRADAPPEWVGRIRDWFGEGYIPSGLNGLARHLSASGNTSIN
jgi:hypothetical protein